MRFQADIHHGDTEGTEMDGNEITAQIIGGAIEVHKALGPGLLESVYEECPDFDTAFFKKTEPQRVWEYRLKSVLLHSRRSLFFRS